MAVTGGVREARREASEAAIVAAAWDLFSRVGPDGASLREVGAAAGCTHALVARYHGSKDGLVGAIATRLATRTDQVVGRAVATARPLRELLGAARAHRAGTRLLVRSALGDLPPRGFPACLHVDWLLTQVRAAGAADRDGPDRRDRLCAYAAASLLLGFVTFEDFLVAATGLGRLPARRRDAAVAAAARHVLRVAAATDPRLAPRDLSAARSLTDPGPGTPAGPRESLLGSAVELFAERGPAAVSVRAVARHAGVNQGLIYRHFGSKDALLAEAIETGSSGLFPAALAESGFDFDAMSWLLHHASPAPRLIARTLVDGIEITSVRRRFPVLRRLLDDYGDLPTGAGPGDLSDPRVAIVATGALAMGSVVWGPHLRPALGLRERDGIEAAIADLARALAAAPLHATTARGGPS